MTEQSYASHAHRPVPSFVAAIFALAAIVLFVGAWGLDWPTLEAGAISLSVAVFALVAASRLYTTRLQDRIILLEMKVRCAEVLIAGADARLGELSPKQIVALRFASDAELGELLEHAIRETLPPTAIKQAIKNWRADNFRA